jgi:RimJ/RimL family protein N-acetyltransferase
VTEGRRVVGARDGVALAELTEQDRESLAADWDRAFEVDADPRPLPISMSVGRLAVVDAGTGELFGSVSWVPVSNGPTLACLAWNVGIGLRPSARGRGAGWLSQRLLAEHLFASTAVDRLQASTDVDNLAEQAALSKAGFRREGVLRGAQLRGGVRRDIVVFGLLRTDG